MGSKLSFPEMGKSPELIPTTTRTDNSGCARQDGGPAITDTRQELSEYDEGTTNGLSELRVEDLALRFPSSEIVERDEYSSIVRGEGRVEGLTLAKTVSRADDGRQSSPKLLGTLCAGKTKLHSAVS